MKTIVAHGSPFPSRSRVACLSALIFLIGALESGADVIPPDRLPPGGMFQAGVPGGIPQNYTQFCDVTVNIPGSSLLAMADGVTDDSAAINAALSLCPANQYVYMPAGTYRIANTIKYPCRSVVLRGAGSQTDVAHTNIKCYTVGTAVNICGGLQFGGRLANLKSGYTVGSCALTFSSASDVAEVAVGDLLVVADDYDPSDGVTVGGSLEAVSLPVASYQWAPSPTVHGAYYLRSANGGNPNLVEANIRQLFYSPGAGTESILTSEPNFSLNAGQWTFGDNDSLGFNTLYVMLPGEVNPATLSAPGDGVPNGGVWYNQGINWGGDNYLSARGVYVHHGQGFKVVSISGATVNLDRPFYWTFSGTMTTASYYIPHGTGQGLESLSIQIMQATPAADAVIVDNTMDSWVKNVEVKNSAQNFIVASYTIDCEFRQNYVHEPFNAQGGSGYGIRMLGWDFNNLIEDNIAYFCRHSFVMDGINTGHVIAYNFSLDPNDSANGTLVTSLINPSRNDGYLYQDFLTHGSNPRFCLYEGNVGGKGYCDYVHGSANYLVYFRNHFRLQEGHILSYEDYLGSETINFDRWNYNMTVVGNILGYPSMQADQLAANGHEMAYEGHTQAIYRLGYDANDNATIVSDNQPKATVVRHGNYDYVNNAIVWDPSNPDHNLPDSLYLTGTPSWFGNMAWPPVDPTNPPLSEGSAAIPGTSLYPIIPAMYRFLNGSPPPSAANLIVQSYTATVPAGGTASFAIVPTGFTTFQWQVSSDGGVTWTALANSATYSGVTSSTLTISNVSASLTGNLYNCVATGVAGTVTSMNGMLIVETTAAAIITGPQAQTVAYGSFATFTVNATGMPAPAFQWLLNGTPLTDGGRVSGSATDALQISDAQMTDSGGEYSVVVSNGVGSPVTSAAAALTVEKASQTITFNSIPAKTTSSPPFSLVATASSGLPVSFTSSNPSVAAVSGSTVTIVGPGTTVITASQAGNADYLAASAVQSLTVTGSAPAYTYYATHFTGGAFPSLTSLELGGDFGNTNNTTYVGSMNFWIRLPNVTSPFANNEYTVFEIGGNQLHVWLRDGTGNDSGKIYVEIAVYGTDTSPGFISRTSAHTQADGWLHIQASWDLKSPQKSCLYVNDVSDSHLQDPLGSHPCRYEATSPAQVSFGSSPTIPGPGQYGATFDICEFWFSETQYVDFTNAANRGLFEGSGDHPGSLGTNGALPTGSPPILYLRSPYSSFGTNSGTGGSFTFLGKGALTAAATKP
ncbi:MAG: immunoglobulin domain-containing protein [Opitutaceae bacterium]|jgi:hypothetical protein